MASERFVVTVEFKPKPTATAFRKLLDENAQISCEREPGPSPCRYPSANDRILFYDSHAAFSLAVAVLRRIQQYQRRLVMNRSVAGFDLKFGGSNSRR